MIRPVQPADAETIARIYNHYVVHSTATFEEQPVSDQEMTRRMLEVASSTLPWLVVEQNEQVQGYAYAAKWKGRSAYRYSVESTIYLAPGLGGRGLGTQLYQALFSLLKEQGLHAVMGGITLPNPASVALHQRMGMIQVAHFKEVGYKFGQWLDVGYWQLVL